MPDGLSRIIKRAGSSNPVFILDEVDKVGQDYRGDPPLLYSKYLILNKTSTFFDNFLEMEYDLSKVLFIATANNLATISPALRDRMELIEITGYLVEEKLEDSKDDICFPKQLENHGVRPDQISIDKKVMEMVIEKYTRESGVRELDKRLAENYKGNCKKHCI